MKIQLIFPDGGSRLSSTGVLPPVGIISLATYLKKKKYYEIELYDEAIGLPKPELTKDILALSVTGANYLRAIEEYTKPAKRNGAIVVLGGPHATIKHKQILKNQGSVDAVIRGDGEIAFSDYIQAISKQDYKKLKVIKNLTYRDEKRDITINPSLARCEQVDLNLLPNPDYRLLGRMLKKYEKNLSSEKYYILKEGFEEGYNIGGYGGYKTHIYETLKKILHNTKRRLKLTSKEKKVYDEGFKVGQEVRERHDEIIGVLFGIYNSDSSLLPKTLIEMIEGKRFCDFQCSK